MDNSENDSVFDPDQSRIEDMRQAISDMLDDLSDEQVIATYQAMMDN
jgi:hypothetical protein